MRDCTPELAPQTPTSFNPSDASFIANPFPVFKQLRDRGPVSYWPQGNAWLVTDYSTCVELMRDPRFSMLPPALLQPSSLPVEEQSPFERFMRNGLFAASGADHARLRRLMSPSFTPKAVQRYRSQILATVEERLSRLDPQTEFDLVSDFAQEVPVRVISGILAIPPEHADTFRALADGVIAATTPSIDLEEQAHRIAAIAPGMAMVAKLIAERRGSSGEDLLSQLVRVEEQGDRLSADELSSLVAALVIAGSETTTHLLAFGVLNLLRHSDQLALLRAQPELMDGAISEILRFDLFGLVGLIRFAREPLSLHGVAIREGDLVYSMSTLIHRDPEHFQDPDRFDIRRDQRFNVAFGQGPHFCVGAHLARLEGSIALGSLLARYPDLRLAGEPVFESHPRLRCMRSLPVSKPAIRGSDR